MDCYIVTSWGEPLWSRAQGPQKAWKHDCHAQGAVIVTVIIRLAYGCKWKDSADRWSNKCPNGLSVTSGGRWLAPYCSEASLDSCAVALFSPVSWSTGGFVFVCDWQIKEWVKTAHWGWTYKAERERNRQVLTTLCSVHPLVCSSARTV